MARLGTGRDTTWTNLIPLVSKINVKHVNELRFAINYLEYRLTAALNGNIGVGKDPTVKLDVAGDVNVDATLSVSGNTTLRSNLNVTSATTTNTLSVTATSVFAGLARLNNNLEVVGTVSVTGASSFIGQLTSKGAVQIYNTLTATGATTLGSTLNVTGDSTFNKVTANGGAIFNDALTVAGESSFNGATGTAGIATHAGKIISTVANGVAPLEVTSKTVNPNFNACMVDGYHFEEFACMPGTVVAYAGTVAPSGWFEANGDMKDPTVYTRLYNVLGTTFGGNGVTTFGLPDIRGIFIRGYDNGKGIDPGRVIGTAQEDAFEEHDHFTLYHGNTSGNINTTTPASLSSDTGGDTEYSLNGLANSIADVSPTSKAGDAETRPKNIALMYIIKY